MLCGAPQMFMMVPSKMTIVGACALAFLEPFPLTQGYAWIVGTPWAANLSHVGAGCPSSLTGWLNWLLFLCGLMGCFQHPSFSHGIQ